MVSISIFRITLGFYFLDTCRAGYFAFTISCRAVPSVPMNSSILKFGITPRPGAQPTTVVYRRQFQTQYLASKCALYCTPDFDILFCVCTLFTKARFVETCSKQYALDTVDTLIRVFIYNTYKICDLVAYADPAVYKSVNRSRV